MEEIFEADPISPEDTPAVGCSIDLCGQYGSGCYQNCEPVTVEDVRGW